MDRVVPAVLVGGAAGAVARWAIGELGWSATIDLLVVNTVGSFVLGMVIARWSDRDHPARLAMGIGVCGGLTTFSGLAVDLAGRLDSGAWGQAALMTVASVVLGIGGFVGGREVVS